MAPANPRAATIVRQASDLPPVPAVAQKILSLLQSERTTATDVESVIAAEPALSARILKIANSALFARRAGARTVGEAVTYVGFKTVRSIVLVASMRSVYVRPRLADHLLWVHSMGVALASAELAQMTRAIPADEALTAGLLHDVGKLVLKAYDSATFDTVMQAIYNEGVSSVEAEVEAFGVGHAEVGEQILAKWGFPDELRVPVALHHVAATAPDAAPASAHVVALADSTCHHLGIGARAADGDLSLSEVPSARALRLSADDMNRFAESFPRKFSEKRLLFE